MAKTLFDMTKGGSVSDKVADWLEQRWFNEGVNKGVQHKAVIKALRYVGSPEGAVSMMPVGMAHQITDPDDIFKLLQMAGHEYRGVKSRLTPLSSAKPQDIGESIMLKQIMPRLHKLSENRPITKVPKDILDVIARLRQDK